MISIVNFEHDKLVIKQWQLLEKENWCVLGRNGSGKQYFNQLLIGELLPTKVEQLTLPAKDKVAMISFEAQQDIYEETLEKIAPDYADINGAMIKAKNFLPEDKWHDPLIGEFGLSQRLDTSYLQLSTGESRKLLILQAIFKGIDLLVCDNPFDSLDIASCQALSDALAGLSQTGITVLLLLNNRQDIPTWFDNVAFIERGQFSVIGKLTDADTKNQLDVLLTPAPDDAPWPDTVQQLADYQHTLLVELIQGTVRYGGVSVFENLDVSIKPLQHTLITGANGSGKSTLMQLITGDCPQCYSNNIHVLGYKRGSGESIWELKAQMGIVSAELHRQYRVSVDLLTVILSGFYDSIGLYQKPSEKQLAIAEQWLEKIGLSAHKQQLFQQLSYGEQRLALVARALVKSPYLLILDEPTQGLDELNRHRVLNFLEHLATQKHSTMLLVSHRQDELLSIFEQHIKL
ncbi:ATP-binding cassette domain-containing protein [Colwellia sp. M166]|uniref:ATP-binding cassette domain-containing protein n=1 Tax=Colwellia sp. M166 TaxID=2583805 RepID=UPI00211E3F06|nr:ATP-binding cassette domain-containing protein [Colwellia sp. M166]UUO22665.1 ATP-binding cassette domain-containing protein [Colwellia sp. M166]|tara:strand:+ start:2119 stop:3498 length:1380 start_codon:yes stop_codon:yes gene_type:complete